MVIAGVPVYGGGDQLEELAIKYDIELVLIAIPSASGPQMTRILGLCHAADVECKTIPGLGDVIEDARLAGQIRDIAVEDLLGRTPVHLQEGAFAARSKARSCWSQELPVRSDPNSADRLPASVPGHRGLRNRRVAVIRNRSGNEASLPGHSLLSGRLVMALKETAMDYTPAMIC